MAGSGALKPASAVAILTAFACAAGAQQARPELGLMAFGPRPRSVEVSVAVARPLGNYVRVGVSVGRAVWSVPDTVGWRGELLGRWVTDPLHERRWGLSLGAGLGIGERSYMLALVDLETPDLAGLRPALQLGLGAGTRAGLVLRRAIAGRR